MRFCPAFLLILAMLWLVPAAALAQEAPGRRPAENVAVRIALQRQLGEWLEVALRGVANPYRVLVSVQLVTRDDLREVQIRRESQPDTEMKLAAQKAVKLPGLPMVGAPVSGFGAPDISVKVPGKQIVDVRRELETLVERVVVKLHVDGAMPSAQRELVKQAAAELAALDFSRGDVIELADLSDLSSTGPPASAPAPVQLTFVQAREILLFGCGTFLLSSLLVALGLALGQRRGSQSAHLEAKLATSDGEAPGAGALEQAAPEEKSPEGSAPKAFSFLAAAGPEQLVEVLSALEPEVAAAALDQLRLDAATSRRLFEELPVDRQVALARALGRQRVVPLVEVAGMEQAARAELERVQSRLRLGGEGRLAELLSLASAEAQQAVLAGLTVADSGLAGAIRGRMLLFEDLARLPTPSVREVVTALGPGVVALALTGATVPIRENVMRSVSKRLQGILAAEADGLEAKSPAEIETARKGVELVMRRLKAQGKLGELRS